MSTRSLAPLLARLAVAAVSLAVAARGLAEGIAAPSVTRVARHLCAVGSQLAPFCPVRAEASILCSTMPSPTRTLQPDLVASKMVALVERGAPRDFRDIHTLCQEGRAHASECWRLWRERRRRAGSDFDPYRARLAIETHLSRIAQHRPLDTIAEPEQRGAAAGLRSWFAQEFLDALVD
jgi:Nucleotidyl transferase AbiEii toxin, Type IV TA system